MRLGELLKAKPEVPGDWDGGMRELPTELVVPNPHQPRRTFRQEDLDELARSIEAHGLLQPVVTRRVADGKFQIVAGERRWRACVQLGLKTIAARVFALTDEAAAELALVENLQRADLDYFEEAEGYKRLIEEFNYTQSELAERVGKSQSAVSNKLRLLQLPERVRAQIPREIFTERHVRALLPLKEEQALQHAIERVEAQALSVSETERLVKRVLDGEAGAESKAKRDRQTVRRVYKDIRLFTNSLKSLLNDLEAAGIHVALEERRDEENVYFQIQVALRKGGS